MRRADKASMAPERQSMEFGDQMGIVALPSQKWFALWSASMASLKRARKRAGEGRRQCGLPMAR